MIVRIDLEERSDLPDSIHVNNDETVPVLWQGDPTNAVATALISIRGGSLIEADVKFTDNAFAQAISKMVDELRFDLRVDDGVLTALELRR